jgi:hypothetical protein
VHFCLPFYYSFILVITLHYLFITALAKYDRSGTRAVSTVGTLS